MKNFVEINKDIINLILNSNEKFFVLIGENSSGKTDIIMELEKLGLFTIDNFRFYDENSIKAIEDNIEAGNKVIISTHDIYEMFDVLYVPDTSVIIATFYDDLYNVASWGDVDKNFVYKLLEKKGNTTNQLLRKLLSISLFENWSKISQEFFETVDQSDLSHSQKILYDMIVKFNNKKNMMLVN